MNLDPTPRELELERELTKYRVMIEQISMLSSLSSFSQIGMRLFEILREQENHWLIEESFADTMSMIQENRRMRIALSDKPIDLPLDKLIQLHYDTQEEIFKQMNEAQLETFKQGLASHLFEVFAHNLQRMNEGDES